MKKVLFVAGLAIASIGVVLIGANSGQKPAYIKLDRQEFQKFAQAKGIAGMEDANKAMVAFLKSKNINVNTPFFEPGLTLVGVAIGIVKMRNMFQKEPIEGYSEIDYLLSVGADLNALDLQGKTPVFYAVDDLKLLKYLESKGANLNVKVNQPHPDWVKHQKQQFQDSIDRFSNIQEEWAKRMTSSLKKELAQLNEKLTVDVGKSVLGLAREELARKNKMLSERKQYMQKEILELNEQMKGANSVVKYLQNEKGLE